MGHSSIQVCDNINEISIVNRVLHSVCSIQVPDIAFPSRIVIYNLNDI